MTTKYDAKEVLCNDIFKTLKQSFEWNQTHIYKPNMRISLFPNMEKFDVKKCSNFAQIPYEIKTVNQEFVSNKYTYSPYFATYHLTYNKGVLDLKYEFKGTAVPL